jgi:hypothetical protein
MNRYSIGTSVRACMSVSDLAAPTNELLTAARSPWVLALEPLVLFLAVWSFR